MYDNKKEYSIKSVKVSRDVYERLTWLKRGNMTYNDVITLLLDYMERKQEKRGDTKNERYIY